MQTEKASRFIEGYSDGCQYFIDGHTELMTQYNSRSEEYRKGFDSAANHPRVKDPDFAS